MKISKYLWAIGLIGLYCLILFSIYLNMPREAEESHSGHFDSFIASLKNSGANVRIELTQGGHGSLVMQERANQQETLEVGFWPLIDMFEYDVDEIMNGQALSWCDVRAAYDETAYEAIKKTLNKDSSGWDIGVQTLQEIPGVLCWRKPVAYNQKDLDTKLQYGLERTLDAEEAEKLVNLIFEVEDRVKNSEITYSGIIQDTGKSMHCQSFINGLLNEMGWIDKRVFWDGARIKILKRMLTLIEDAINNKNDSQEAMIGSLCLLNALLSYEAPNLPHLEEKI